MDGKNAERRERFLRLSEKRVNDVLKRVRLLGNLSNKGSYAYDLEEVNSIFDAVQRELDEQARRFLPKEPKKKQVPRWSWEKANADAED